MATFYADHDTSVHVAAGLGRLGHTTATAYGLQQRLAHDAQQLLTAAPS